MFKLIKETDQYAIYLDHKNLINEAYKEFQLRQELFHFELKKTLKEFGAKKRKRKANDKESEPQSDPQVIEYLGLLPEPAPIGEAKPLAKCWENSYSVPQLHGANKSGRMQRFQYQEDVYLIPDRACFYNHNVDQLPTLLPQLLPAYDLIVMDPPWRNKYIRRLKKAKKELGYGMMDTDQLALMPLSSLIHPRSLVAIWCTNSGQHQTALEQQLLPKWNLRLVHKLRWYKLNTDHQLITPPQADLIQKQPYEMLYVACHTNAAPDYGENLQKTQLLMNIPSIIHSHKPPLLEWLREHIVLEEGQKEPNCLELFARYLQPQFTSIGMEVLKLMNQELYNC
ncbi:uncharacterized protein Dana_GF27048 [Drosophila ananassae]|uniref:Methyltransferase-like protein 4 n=1 Tax=Drosophila ananassae TaxID=7217 RepID=A0A0P8YDT7_DROAN|nr:N(6)-adenine-specific methyltransferase METTL4 [Drosophila ananassae]KPU79662.1 uncharacterized protein Dana_GF27048 [Drosophila ananassae]